MHVAIECETFKFIYRNIRYKYEYLINYDQGYQKFHIEVLRFLEIILFFFGEVGGGVVPMPYFSGIIFPFELKVIQG